MPFPLGAVLGAAIPAVAGLFGAERASRTDRSEAEKNRQFQAGEAQTNRLFQERMRNTSWQAALADIEKAGLNPALAYSQGGAQVPGGAMASGSLAAPTRDSVSSAMQTLQGRAQLELMKESIAKTRAEGETAQALAVREKARNMGYGIKEVDGQLQIDYSLPGLVQETQATVKERIAAAARAQSMAEISGLGGQVAQGFGQVMPAFQSIMGVAGQGAESLAGVVNMLERVARMRDDAVQATVGMSRKAVLELLAKLRGPLGRTFIPGRN